MSETFSHLFMCPCPFLLSNLYSGLSQILYFSTKFLLHHLMLCPNVFIQLTFPLEYSRTPHQSIPIRITFFRLQNYIFLCLNPDIFFPILFPPESIQRCSEAARQNITDPVWAPQSLMKGAAKPLPLHLINYSRLEICSFFHQPRDCSFPHQFSKFPSVSSPRVNVALSYTNFSRRQTKKECRDQLATYNTNSISHSCQEEGDTVGATG